MIGSQYSVLIADDSRLVCTALTSILRAKGIDQVKTVTKPSDLMAACKREVFDIIICDFNFNCSLNGFQIFEELKHFRILPPKTAFIFLTGENDRKVVRSITSADPDGYILKPFNRATFGAKIINTFHRRAKLNPIFEAIHANDPRKVIEACDEVITQHPEHAICIRKYKAQSYFQLQQYEQAKAEYSSLLEDTGLEWSFFGLANSLIECGNLDHALSLLGEVKTKDKSHDYHDAMSAINLIRGDIPLAIEHLKQSTALIDAGAERDMVIVNLSLSVESYDDAAIHMKRYYKRNASTYRGNDFTKANYIRAALFEAQFVEEGPSLTNRLSSIRPMVDQLASNEALSIQYQVISAHLAMLQGELKVAEQLLNETLVLDLKLHFYDYYHLLMVLDLCSNYKAAVKLLPTTRESIQKGQLISIHRSQVQLAQSIEKRIRNKQRNIEIVYRKIRVLGKVTQENLDEYIQLYCQLHKLTPRSKKVSMTLIRLLAETREGRLGINDLPGILQDCDETIRGLFSRSELKSKNYQNIYTRAEKNCYGLA